MNGPPWHAMVDADAHARAWVSLQADLLLADNTVVAYARGLKHYLDSC